MTDVRIGPDREVTLHFALKLENGDVVDSTFDKQPATFKVGDGNLLPGFEQALYGFKAGDKRNVQVQPEQGVRPAESAECADHAAQPVRGHGAFRGVAGDLQRCRQHRATWCGQSIR